MTYKIFQTDTKLINLLLQSHGLTEVSKDNRNVFVKNVLLQFDTYVLSSNYIGSFNRNQFFSFFFRNFYVIINIRFESSSTIYT